MVGAIMGGFCWYVMVNCALGRCVGVCDSGCLVGEVWFVVERGGGGLERWRWEYRGDIGVIGVVECGRLNAGVATGGMEGMLGDIYRFAVDRSCGT